MTAPHANRFISMIYRYGQRIFARMLRQRQLPVEAGQLPFLFQVYRHPGITQEGISANIGMDKGTTARIITQLENSGMVTRNPDEKDRRLNRIHPTQAALDIHPEITEIVEEFHSLLYQGLSPEEITLAKQLLIHMKDNLAAYLREDRGAVKPGSTAYSKDAVQKQ